MVHENDNPSLRLVLKYFFKNDIKQCLEFYKSENPFCFEAKLGLDDDIFVDLRFICIAKMQKFYLHAKKVST